MIELNNILTEIYIIAGAGECITKKLYPQFCDDKITEIDFTTIYYHHLQAHVNLNNKLNKLFNNLSAKDKNSLCKDKLDIINRILNTRSALEDEIFKPVVLLYNELKETPCNQNK